MPNKAKSEGVTSELQEWLDAISTYEREFKKWEGRVDKILKRYRDESRDNKSSGTDSRFNILWSNVQTLVPATFSRLPIPDVTRRFKDNDPVGRIAALILERALDFEIQHYNDYRSTLSQSVHDRFLGGRASAWVRYEPHFKAIEGEQITEDVEEPEIKEQLDYECTPVDYVHWKDFGHNVARTWEEVTQVWRRVYMSESAVEERFGEDWAKRIPYDSTPEELKRASREGNSIKKQAAIYELWDKEESCAVWICKGIKEPLDQVEDPLGLQDFFPCPKPLFATITNDSLIPVPDFTLYQDQANQLDILADRIAGLAKMLQLKGVYDASAPELGRLFTEGGNGDLLPVKNYAAFAEKGGLKGGVDLLDLTQLAQAMQTAVESFAQCKGQIDELTGLADIVRGLTDPNETLGAQQLKGQYAGLRLKDKQQGVAEFATEILRLKAQVMCRKFDPKTLSAMAAVEQLNPADQQMIPQALALLVGQERMLNPEADSPNPMRSFRIEIAADTLVELDEQQEKKDRMEFLTANGSFMEKAVGMMSQAGPAAPILAPVIMELWKFGITAFKVGKNVEGVLDMAADKLKELAKQPPPQPPPDPAIVKAQIDAQANEKKLQQEAQQEQSRQALEQQRHAAELQQKSATEQAQLQKEEAIALREHDREMEKLRSDSNLEQLKADYNQDTELKKVALQVAGQIEVAKINAESKNQSDALNAQATVEAAKETGKAQVQTAKATPKPVEPKEGIDANKIMQDLLKTHSELLKTIANPPDRELITEGGRKIVRTIK